MKLTKQRIKENKELFKQGLKQCPHCTEPKPISDFVKSSTHKDGLYCYCKEHQREYSLKNKEEIAKKAKECREKPENKIELAKKAKERYEKNKEQIAKKAKKYNARQETKTKRNKRRKNKTESDTNYKIREILRHRVYMALKGNSKSLPSMFLIGCEIDYLMCHLQEQFQPGMSWDNYGLWHMDHIKPCSKFDLSKKSEQLKCFNYTNLQPLWAEDNRRKGNKYE